MRLDGWTPLLVIVAGGPGGFGNALLGGVLRRPRKVRLPDRTAVYATALISGLGGARVLNDFLVKRNLKGTVNGLAAELGATVPSAHG